jgi:hypothetical protein
MGLVDAIRRWIKLAGLRAWLSALRARMKRQDVTNDGVMKIPSIADRTRYQAR